jgi:hypothetical protein
MTLRPLVFSDGRGQGEWIFLFSGHKSFANAALTLIKLRAKVCAANCFFDLRNPFVAANVLWLRFSSRIFAGC